uniref:Uncharacterized protein n=1 Tax=Candidatus Desulfatibia profunda TaxID=2841695 RepID=A0A8J6NTL6_9BACT|nr:hypothetical protein [Candidatus Desulfatibia profunda]
MNSSGISVRELKAEDFCEWDKYCENNLASYASYSIWTTILPNLGCKPVFLIAKDRDNKVIGVFPSALILRRGYRLGISTWADGRMYAGPIADSPEIAQELLLAFDETCKKYRISLIRIIVNPWSRKCSIAESKLQELGYKPKTLYDSLNTTALYWI